MRKFIAFFAVCVASVFGVEQEQATPYDLIRPVFPLVWDTASVDNGGTVESFSSFVPNKSKRKPVPPVGAKPADFVPNAFVPDTLNQAFLDARNLRIGRIRINQAGYLAEDIEKHFYYVSNDAKCADKYSVVDLSGKELVTNGILKPTGHKTESSWKIVAATDAATNNQNRYTASQKGPSGAVCEGFLAEHGSLPTDQRLRIKIGKEYSSTFIISDRVYSMVRDATIKFYGINRSGTSDSWFHKPSHTKDGGGKFVAGEATASGFTSQEGALQGGWYDCGDHLKESQTQAYAFMVLAVMAASNPDRDEDNYAYNHGETVNTDGIPDILREAKHGADFFLRAYDFADGVIDNMAVSVGNFGADHGWWGRPENQDALPTSVVGRGGPHERDIRLGELGSNISGQIAAGLAILSKEYAMYDKEFAEKCLVVAEKMYDFAKNLKLKEKSLGPGTYDGGKKYVYNTKADGWASSAYNGNNESHDDLAAAAIALHYATYEKTGKMDYLNDAVEDQEIGDDQENGIMFFPGGWMAWNRDGMRKSSKNTSWANAYTYTLYGFYKLLLVDDATAQKYGISHDKRLKYAEAVAYTLAENLRNMSGSGSSSITLPGVYNDPTLTYGDLWYNMQTDQTWIYNRYQAGNIFEVFAYADVTKDLEGVKLPGKGQRMWHSKEVKQLGINQLNYMLGMNPWDVSYLLGIGDKNDAHPHHRASNPEGKNMPGAAYKYNPPVGALYGGITPSVSAGNDMAPDGRSWEDYHKAETCIDGTAMFLAAGALAVKAEDRNRAPKEINVEIRYAGFDTAIVNITQDMRGSAYILASTSETGPFVEIYRDSVIGVKHTIGMGGLKNGTTYYFKVVAVNTRSEQYATKWLVDSTATPFYFTTLASEAPDADIQNVKVCNLTADSAEIMWYTPNGQYESKIYWDTVMTTYDKMAFNTGKENADVSGIPTSFHYVKIGGLKEQTTYYYCVESNGSRRCVDDGGQPLKFITPVEQFNFEIRSYQYVFGGMDFLNMNIYNNEEKAFDSLTLRLYLRATEDELAECALMIDSDICQAYDEAGFNKPCENDREIRDLLRGSQAVKLEDTYDAKTKTYAWYFPAPLGSTTIKSSSRLRIDLGFSQGMHQPNDTKCDPLRSAPKKRFCPGVKEDDTCGEDVTDWTWRPHKFGASSAERADYEGMPILAKDFGDADQAPVNPYIVVYRKDQFVWGYSPSYTEMTTKRANYEMTVTLDKPFNVSNGSYVKIDSTKSTLYVKGTALITEGGYVTAIWVNGTALTKEQLKNAAVYNYDTQKYDLNIPVKMSIGTNKVDVTIFAGPDPECEACQENGGCAFVNRSYFVQFSKGNRTASILTLVDNKTGSAVSSPAPIDGSLQFYVDVKDKDNKDSKSIVAYVVNSRTGDSLKITLNRVNEVTGEFKSGVITAKNDKKASYPTIPFFGGDTITVVYIDSEDEEDISFQKFFAAPTHPVPQKALITDSNCDAQGDVLTATFVGNTFEKSGVKLERAEIAFDSTTTQAAMTVSLTPSSIDGATVTFNFGKSEVPATGAPTGTVTFYMLEDGVETSESIALTDGIAPALESVMILENVSDPRAANDTLKLTFTEPVMMPSSAWPLVVTDDGKDVNQSTIKVLASYPEENGKIWKYVVTGNTNGDFIVGKNDDHPGFYASIKDGFGITDYGFNDLTDCRGEVEIIEAVKAVHVTFSQMSDFTGDGQPDEIYMTFADTLDNKHTPDSLLVYWGNPAVYQVFRMPKNGWNKSLIDEGFTVNEIKEKVDSVFVEEKKTPYDSLTGETIMTCDTLYQDVKDTVIDEDTGEKKEIVVGKEPVLHDGQPECTGWSPKPEIKKAYKRDTIWDYTLAIVGYDTIYSRYSSIKVPVESGVYKNMTHGSRDGKGLMIQGGNFFDPDSAAVQDSCPPVVVRATWKVASGNAKTEIDNLVLVMSEPLDTIASDNPHYVERKRNGEKGKYLTRKSLFSLPATSNDFKQSSYLYRYEADSVVWSGDSVRLIPTALSYFKDKAGIMPGIESPWVKVEGSVDRIKFSVKPLEKVAKKKQDEVYYGGETLDESEQFRLSVVSDKGERVIAHGKQDLEPVTRMKDVKDYNHAGPTFRIDIALPDVFEEDTVSVGGGMLYNYTLNIALDIYSNLGGFVNEMSYKLNLNDVREFVSANSVLTVYLEWCAPGAAPTSIDNRLVGTGPYIAKFDFKGKGVSADPNAEKQKTSKLKTVTFGVRR